MGRLSRVKLFTVDFQGDELDVLGILTELLGQYFFNKPSLNILLVVSTRTDNHEGHLGDFDRGGQA